MTPDRKEKNEWRDHLMLALSPLMSHLGFKRASKDSYKRQHTNRTDFYYVGIRHLRTTSPPFAKLSAAVAVDFPRLKKLEWQLSPELKGRKIAAVGGTMGLFTKARRHIEWPVSDLDSALALRPEFENEIKEAAVPFWDAFPTVEALLAALEAEHPWTSLQRRMDLLRVAVLVLARDAEAALDFVREHPERYRRHGGVEGVSQKLRVIQGNREGKSGRKSGKSGTGYDF